MGITKRRKQQFLYREGARHAALDPSALDTAHRQVQHAAVASMEAHGRFDDETGADDVTEETDYDSADSTSEHSKSSASVREALQRLDEVSNQLDGSEPTPQ